MIFDHQSELRDRIESLSNRRVYGPVEIFEDTSSYMAIYGGSVLRLEGNDYFILGDAREDRFGIDEQPKFWVKYAVDLTTGAQKILKLVFHEEFTATVGPVTVRCRRSPDKESAILDLVRGQPRFMQGITVADQLGGRVRVIDFIRGKNIFVRLNELRVSHEIYFHQVLPGLMREIIGCIEAVAFLHRNGQHHGDIRNDHILVPSDGGAYAWIDFDYEVNYSDYDVWSMGNVLNFVVGKGLHTFRSIQTTPEAYPGRTGECVETDALLLYRYRVANLRRLFPYISEELNAILMRFSVGATEFYEDLESQVRDLRAVFP
jgi:hypothetical protein